MRLRFVLADCIASRHRFEIARVSRVALASAIHGRLALSHLYSRVFSAHADYGSVIAPITKLVVICEVVSFF
jgi:hypothetical protein